jgi:hypothetical protein
MTKLVQQGMCIPKDVSIVPVLIGVVKCVDYDNLSSVSFSTLARPQPLPWSSKAMVEVIDWRISGGLNIPSRVPESPKRLQQS